MCSYPCSLRAGAVGAGTGMFLPCIVFRREWPHAQALGAAVQATQEDLFGDAVKAAKDAESDAEEEDEADEDAAGTPASAPTASPDAVAPEPTTGANAVNCHPCVLVCTCFHQLHQSFADRCGKVAQFRWPCVVCNAMCLRFCELRCQLALTRLHSSGWLHGNVVYLFFARTVAV